MFLRFLKTIVFFPYSFSIRRLGKLILFTAVLGLACGCGGKSPLNEIAPETPPAAQKDQDRENAPVVQTRGLEGQPAGPSKPAAVQEQAQPRDNERKPAIEPDLYVVAVGIDRYAADAGFGNLRYCASDAQAIAGLFRLRSKPLYRHVNVNVLLDEQATRAGILDKLAGLARTVRPVDTFVFYAAGHGCALGGSYFIVPHDLKMEKGKAGESIRRSALARADLGKALLAVPARQRVFIFDTSSAGAAAKWFDKEKGVSFLAVEGEGAESRELKHGLLAYTLLAGGGAVDGGPLKGKAIEPPAGGKAVGVADWFQYAERQVPEVYEAVRGRQEKVIRTGDVRSDVKLFAMEMPRKQEAADKSQDIPTDVAVLELSVPEGVTVSIEGKDIGKERRYTFRSLQPGKLYSNEVRVRWPDGKETARTVLVKAGWQVRLPILPDKVERPEMVLQTGHIQKMNAVAFSPDGKQVFTGSSDTTAVLWNATSGQILRTFRGSSEMAYWTSGKLDHNGAITSVAFSPDGKQLLTGSANHLVVLWNAVSGQKLRTFEGHSQWVNEVAFSPDGKQVLSGSGDSTAILWDAANGKQLCTYKHKNIVRAVTFSPNGKQVLTGTDENTALLWDAASGENLRAYRHPEFNANFDRVGAVAFSPDGKQVLTGSFDQTAVLWDAANGEKLRTFAGHPWEVFAVAFSPDGKQVLTGTHKSTATLWDVASGQKLRTLQGPEVEVMAFSPDGKQVLTGSSDHAAALWEVASGNKLRTFLGCTHTVAAATFSSNGTQVLTGTGGSGLLWNVASGQKLCKVAEHTHDITSVAFSPDGRQVLSAANYDAPVQWNVANGQKMRTLPYDNVWVYAVAFSSDGKKLLTAAGKTAVLRDAASGEKLKTFEGHSHWVSAVAFSPDGKRVLTGAKDSSAILWDAANGRQLATFKTGHWVNSVAFSPDGKHVLIGSLDKLAVLWADTAREPLVTFAGHQGAVFSVASSPDGKQVLTGSGDTTAVVWDAVSGQKLRTLRGHTDWVNSVMFSLNGRSILTGSSDGTTRLWDIATGDELCRLISIDAGKDWAVVTPEGLFDGSKGGREKSYFREGTGLNIVPLDHFFQEFYYPGLLAAIWRGERPMPGKPFQISPAPSVKMLVQSQKSEVRDQKSEVTIDVAVTDRGGGIKSPWLKHNRAAVRAANTLVRKDGKTEHHRFSLSLVPGENHVEVRAATADGSVESEPAGITIPFDGKLPEPELHVVVVGINVYLPNDWFKNLRYCVADAEGIADLLQKRAAKSYGKVHVTRLLDDKATKAEILNTLADLSKTVKPQDTLIFFCASHGVTLGQRYFLIPHDLKMGEENPREDLRKGALAVDELSEPLAAIPALKRVLIFDTCESGSATSLAGKDNNPFAFRGAAERLNRAQGVYCLAGATATEKAAESRDLKHSILTYTLLAGAGAVDKGPLAGLKVKGGEGERGLDVLDWFRYARQNVPLVYEEVRGKAQNIEISGEDQPGFPLLAP